MKIKTDFYGRVRFNLRTSDHGGSAINQFVDDPNTVVYYGDLHASVRFLDLRIEVEMDPHEGQWKDAEWAREHAWSMVREHLTLKHFQQAMEAATAHGKKLGTKEAQASMRAALGVSDGFSNGWICDNTIEE